MKKIFKGLFVLLFLILLSGCAKDYKAITSSKFIETLKNEKGYLVNTHTQLYDSNIEESIAASSENSYFLFFVFGDKKEAKEYVKTNYKDLDGYSYKDYGDYVEVKSTKNGFFRLIQIDKTVLSGNTTQKSSKKEIKNIFKKLGY